MRRFGMAPVLLAGLVLAAWPAAAEEAASFRLPNGLEVRWLHMANAGTVRARLVFTIREGPPMPAPGDGGPPMPAPGDGGPSLPGQGDSRAAPPAPEGTAFLMSKALPLLGCAGMERAAFEALKDRSGALSQVDGGRGWISWTFESLPSNAEMMIQLLADESLRPAWSKSGGLQGILDKLWERGRSGDAREGAVLAFRAAAGDPAVGGLPEGPYDQGAFVAQWSAAVRRPERAVLSVVGDIESIHLRRAVAQHFGPWDGVRRRDGGTGGARAVTDDPGGSRPSGAGGATLARDKGKTADRAAGAGAPEVWVAWDLGALPQDGALALAALMPWLLGAAMPAPDGIIRCLEADPGGRWARAIGASGVSTESLESRLREMLAAPLTQGRLDAALKARDEHARADALHPGRMLERLGQDPPPAPPALEELAGMLAKCVGAGSLDVLALR